MSAAKGNAEAEINIGNLYQQGWGVTQDYTEAMKWYKFAAAKGNEEAEKNIRYMNKHGLKGEMDPGY